MPGLRRDEVADRAGVSTDYYTRLEQGRERHPSPSVVDALARALELPPDATDHLHGLVAPRRVPPRTERGRTPAQLLDHLADWSATPAYVVDSSCDVLESNAAGSAMHPGLSRDRNMMRLLFLDDAERGMYRDWPRQAALSVAWLRAAAGPAPQPRLRALVADLQRSSPAFAGLWAKHDVATRADGLKELDHPATGRLTLRHMALTVDQRAGLTLVLYQVLHHGWDVAGGPPGGQVLVRGS